MTGWALRTNIIMKYSETKVVCKRHVISLGKDGILAVISEAAATTVARKVICLVIVMRAGFGGFKGQKTIDG